MVSRRTFIGGVVGAAALAGGGAYLLQSNSSNTSAVIDTPNGLEAKDIMTPSLYGTLDSRTPAPEMVQDVIDNDKFPIQTMLSWVESANSVAEAVAHLEPYGNIYEKWNPFEFRGEKYELYTGGPGHYWYTHSKLFEGDDGEKVPHVQENGPDVTQFQFVSDNVVVRFENSDNIDGWLFNLGFLSYESGEPQLYVLLDYDNDGVFDGFMYSPDIIA